MASYDVYNQLWEPVIKPVFKEACRPFNQVERDGIFNHIWDNLHEITSIEQIRFMIDEHLSNQSK